MAMDIELRLLRSFVAIYEHRAISRAASRLACTQAAMSMRLKILETEIGESLFLRQHHKLEPTFKATELYAKALSVLAAYDEMISATRSRQSRQKLRLGFPDDYALGLLPDTFTALHAAGDDIEVEIICDLSSNLSAAFQRGDVDLALVTLETRPPSAVLGLNMALSWVAHPALKPGAAEAVALAAYPEGCVFRRAMIASLDRAGRTWHVAAQSRNHAGILAAVWGQLGVTAMARGTAPAGLCENPQALGLPSLPTVPLYLLSREHPASARLEAILRQQLQSYGMSVIQG